MFLLMLAACQPSLTIGEEGKTYHAPRLFNGKDYLIRIFEGGEYESGAPCGYVNLKGDTIVPVGKYSLCWTDTIRTFGIVFDQEYIAIEELYPAARKILEKGRVHHRDWCAQVFSACLPEPGTPAFEWSRRCAQWTSRSSLLKSLQAHRPP